jgi:hypothetical protein
MIKKLSTKDRVSLYDFVIDTKDVYEDFYITENKERHFLKNWFLVNKILKTQEVYGLFEKELSGILLIYRSKNFRPYLKVLAKTDKYLIDMLKWFRWNFNEIDMYLKVKKDNPLSRKILKTGFILIGNRGKENLFFKKGIKQLYKLTPKDNYLEDNEHRLY